MSCIDVQCSRHDSGRGRTHDRTCEPRRCPVTGLPHYPKCCRRSDGPETEASTAVSTKRWRCGMSCSPNWPASTASPDASRWTPPSACCGAWLHPGSFSPSPGPRRSRFWACSNPRACGSTGCGLWGCTTMRGRQHPRPTHSCRFVYSVVSTCLVAHRTGNWSSLRCSPRGFWRALPSSS